MATPGQLQMYNKLEVGEMFSLDHRAKDKRTGVIHRIHIYPDEKVPDAVVFHIWLEDHTLGNILRMELLRNDDVLFVGYKVPHPLDHMIELRLQTLPKSTPEQALRRAVANLRSEARSMLDQFDVGVATLQSQGKPLAIEEGPSRMRTEAEWDHRDSSATPDVDSMSGPGVGAFSPLGEDRRFQEQLEQMERMAEEADGPSSPSFSPAGRRPVPTSEARGSSPARTVTEDGPGSGAGDGAPAAGAAPAEAAAPPPLPPGAAAVDDVFGDEDEDEAMGPHPMDDDDDL